MAQTIIFMILHNIDCLQSHEIPMAKLVYPGLQGKSVPKSQASRHD